MIELLLIPALIVFFAFLLLSKSPSFKGYMGEQKVSRKLDIFGGVDDGYPTFHDVTLKNPDGSTQVDHILISPYGIFVIETKNLTGWIFGDEKQRQWTQTIYKKKYRFQNPLFQNYRHVKVLEKLLGANIEYIFNIVVFAGDSTFKTTMPNNVVYLKNFVSHINSYTKIVLNRQTIKKYSSLINHAIDKNTITKSEHINNLRQSKNIPICPRCGKSMVLRTARKGSSAGSEFLGCSGFPSCKATKKIG